MKKFIFIASILVPIIVYCCAGSEPVKVKEYRYFVSWTCQTSTGSSEGYSVVTATNRIDTTTGLEAVAQLFIGQMTNRTQNVILKAFTPL